jgi:hypothetical protein
MSFFILLWWNPLVNSVQETLKLLSTFHIVTCRHILLWKAKPSQILPCIVGQVVHNISKGHGVFIVNYMFAKMKVLRFFSSHPSIPQSSAKPQWASQISCFTLMVLWIHSCYSNLTVLMIYHEILTSELTFLLVYTTFSTGVSASHECCQYCEIWGSYSSVLEDSGVTGCDALLPGLWFLWLFQRTMVP